MVFEWSTDDVARGKQLKSLKTVIYNGMQSGVEEQPF